MSSQSINLSCTDLIEKLSYKKTPRWSVTDGELDTICLNKETLGEFYEVGIICQLLIKDGKYTFHVYEFATDGEQEQESTEDFNTFDEMLRHVNNRIEMYLEF